MKVYDTSICQFCQLEEQSYIHLYRSCHLVQDFWKAIFNKIYLAAMNTGERIDFEFCKGNILLGLFAPKDTFFPIIITMVKKYIYTHMIQAKHLSVMQIWSNILWFRDVEEKILFKQK